MASLFRRKRSLIFKLVLGIPTLWLFIVIFISFQNSGNDAAPYSKDSRIIVRENRDLNPIARLKNAIVQPFNQPFNPFVAKTTVIVRGDVDWDAGKVPRPDKSVVRSAGSPVEDTRNHVDYDDTMRWEPASPDAPGEGGKAVSIDKESLSQIYRKIYDEGWQDNAFNQFASDKISLHRTLQDVRDPECRTLSYKPHLPDTSVVICFHNEAWSVLLRTFHSVLDRSPQHLVREIILVDDFSDKLHLRQKLEDYIAPMKKVKIVRTKQREGLIRARLLGFSVAKGDVVTFLDSHCECTEGWLEPLLHRIAQNSSNVVCPTIDNISDETFGYRSFDTVMAVNIGVFDLSMSFHWKATELWITRPGVPYTTPIRTPTMAGGLFSISREYFEHLGTYDPGMDIWGGENLELSFRVWMCGGVLEIVPCSHVGHIFRKRSPYKWRGGVNVVKKNTVRLAEVWMDEYKDYYYERFNHDLGEFGDVTERKELRKRLNCKSFDWYVKNIYPDLFVPGEALASGEIRSKAKPMCVDSAVDSQNYHKPVNMWPCHNQGGNQYWMLSKQSEIRRDDGCLDYSGGESVIVYPCHGQRGNQEWKYKEDNTLVHMNTNKCMEVSMDGQKLLMRACTGIDRQIWAWKRKSPDGVIRV